jgi:hypothetical protein
MNKKRGSKGAEKECTITVQINRNIGTMHILRRVASESQQSVWSCDSPAGYWLLHVTGNTVCLAFRGHVYEHYAPLISQEATCVSLKYITATVRADNTLMCANTNMYEILDFNTNFLYRGGGNISPLHSDGLICSPYTAPKRRRASLEQQYENNSKTILKTKLHGLSPRAKYTNRATGACRRSDCQSLRIEGATWSVRRIPYGRILGFLDRIRFFSIK